MVVVVIPVVSVDKLDKETKTNELQNYIYFSADVCSTGLDIYDTMDNVCKRPSIQQMVADEIPGIGTFIFSLIRSNAINL